MTSTAEGKSCSEPSDETRLTTHTYGGLHPSLAYEVSGENNRVDQRKPNSVHGDTSSRGPKPVRSSSGSSHHPPPVVPPKQSHDQRRTDSEIQHVQHPPFSDGGALAQIDLGQTRRSISPGPQAPHQAWSTEQAENRTMPGPVELSSPRDLSQHVGAAAWIESATPRPKEPITNCERTIAIDPLPESLLPKQPSPAVEIPSPFDLNEGLADAPCYAGLDGTLENNPSQLAIPSGAQAAIATTTSGHNLSFSSTPPELYVGGVQAVASADGQVKITERKRCRKSPRTAATQDTTASSHPHSSANFVDDKSVDLNRAENTNPNRPLNDGDTVDSTLVDPKPLENRNSNNPVGNDVKAVDDTPVEPEHLETTKPYKTGGDYVPMGDQPIRGILAKTRAPQNPPSMTEEDYDKHIRDKQNVYTKRKKFMGSPSEIKSDFCPVFWVPQQGEASSGEDTQLEAGENSETSLSPHQLPQLELPNAQAPLGRANTPTSKEDDLVLGNALLATGVDREPRDSAEGICPLRQHEMARLPSSDFATPSTPTQFIATDPSMSSDSRQTLSSPSGPVGSSEQTSPTLSSPPEYPQQASPLPPTPPEAPQQTPHSPPIHSKIAQQVPLSPPTPPATAQQAPPPPSALPESSEQATRSPNLATPSDSSRKHLDGSTSQDSSSKTQGEMSTAEFPTRSKHPRKKSSGSRREKAIANAVGFAEVLKKSIGRSGDAAKKAVKDGRSIFSFRRSKEDSGSGGTQTGTVTLNTAVAQMSREQRGEPSAMEVLQAREEQLPQLLEAGMGTLLGRRRSSRRQFSGSQHQERYKLLLRIDHDNLDAESMLCEISRNRSNGSVNRWDEALRQEHQGLDPDRANSVEPSLGEDSNRLNSLPSIGASQRSATPTVVPPSRPASGVTEPIIKEGQTLEMAPVQEEQTIRQMTVAHPDDFLTTPGGSQLDPGLLQRQEE